MGWGQSSIKRSNTTPITVKENKVMTNKDYQNQWNNDRPATDRNIRNVDWNVDNSKSSMKNTIYFNHVQQVFIAAYFKFKNKFYNLWNF